MVLCAMFGLNGFDGKDEIFTPLCFELNQRAHSRSAAGGLRGQRADFIK
jgi:hypothetical protein